MDTNVPESQQKPPENLNPGWKEWSDDRFRWWTGTQWTDTFLMKKPIPDPPPLGATIEATNDEGVFVKGQVYAVDGNRIWFSPAKRFWIHVVGWNIKVVA